MQVKKLFVVSLFTLALVPATASAQNWFVTPFVGTNVGGRANFEDFAGTQDDEFESRIDFGATAGWNPGIVGFEVDLGWSPKFFDETPGIVGFQSDESYVLTFMGNVLVSAPPGTTIRPYGSAGMGVIRSGLGSSADEFGKFSDNKWGFNAGGGVNGNFTDNMGIRGDLRFFRSIEADDVSEEFDIAFSRLEFWRATVGFMFRW